MLTKRFDRIKELNLAEEIVLSDITHYKSIICEGIPSIFLAGADSSVMHPSVGADPDDRCTYIAHYQHMCLKRPFLLSKELGELEVQPSVNRWC
jgi:hypothetical protein